jgi:glycosyltransferase involved in cell wall biosynthesis
VKILLSAYACAPNRGSEFGTAWNWALYLAKTGLEVSVLTRTHDREAINRSLSNQNENLKLTFYFIDVPSWSKKLFKGQLGAIFHYLVWQHEILKFVISFEEEYDIVHHVSYGSVKSVSKLYKMKKPFILGPIGGGQVAPTGFGAILGKYQINEIIRKIIILYLINLSPATRSMMRNAHFILTTNKETEHLVKRLGAKNTCLFLDSGLSNEFLPKEFPIRKQREVLKILWVGKLIPIKAVQLALFVMKKSKVPAMLTIVGDGSLGKELKNIIDRDSKLRQKVDWWGKVPWHDVRNAYLDNDVFLFTSLRDSFGSQLLEAMGFGLPIICLNHHGARDFIPDDAGFKIDISNFNETINNIVLAIKQLYANPNMRIKMGMAGYKYAREQTWPRRVNLMLKIYKMVLQHHNSNNSL